MATPEPVTTLTEPRRRLPRAQREQQMLDVAARVFAARGFHAATMDEIAAEVGVTKPMLYAYFGSKENLYLASVDRAGVELLDRLRRAASPGLPADRRLWAGVLAFLDFVEEHRAGWSVLYNEMASSGGPFAERVAEFRRAITLLIDSVLREAGGGMALGKSVRASAEPLAHALVGAGESLANWWLANPGSTREDVATHLMDFAWVGLGQLAQGEEWRPPAPRS